MKAVAVVGGGAFGTAMATVAARGGNAVMIWALEPEVVDQINSTHENQVFLPGVGLDAAIRATTSIEDACRNAEIVLMVPPAQHLRTIGAQVNACIPDSVPVVICSKGVERGTGALMSEVAGEAMPGNTVAILSGPTFADELARGMPSAVTLACRDQVAAAMVANALGSRTFRPYTSDDVIGAQIGGATKNVLAIAAGIATGLGAGENARAGVITRGVVEMTRLGLARGARAETLMGLSGLGDLLLTCVSAKSRNTSLGIALAEGRTLDEVLGERKSVAEGVHTAAALVELSARLGIEMPIAAAVNAVLTGSVSIEEAVEGLLSRPLKAESEV